MQKRKRSGQVNLAALNQRLLTQMVLSVRANNLLEQNREEIEMEKYKTRKAAAAERTKRNNELSGVNWCWIVDKLPSGEYTVIRTMLR